MVRRFAFVASVASIGAAFAACVGEDPSVVGSDDRDASDGALADSGGQVQDGGVDRAPPTDAGSDVQLAPCTPGVLVPGPRGGPTTCAYGEACASDGGCSAIASSAACPAGTPPPWDFASRPPVVAWVDAGWLESTDLCGNDASAGLVALGFYAPEGFPPYTNFASRQGLVRIIDGETAGVPSGPGNFIVFPEAGVTSGEMQVVMCDRAANGPLLVFLRGATGEPGNALCATYFRP